MTARFRWRRRDHLSNIHRRAAETSDPLERLRFVRCQMDEWQCPERERRSLPLRILAAITAAIRAALR